MKDCLCLIGIIVMPILGLVTGIIIGYVAFAH